PAVAALFGQILDALGFAHARGMLHRDIKPENVLLDGEGGALLADLGLAISTDQLERDRGPVAEILGTPAYMAPEQFLSDSRDLGPSTDLYAVGVMLFEILSGARPFSGAPVAILRAKRAGPPPLRPRPGYPIPEGLAGIVARLLDPDPYRRFALAADVKA